MAHIHEQSGFATGDLTTPEALRIVDETVRIIQRGVSVSLEETLSPAFRHKIENDIFMFSGFKTMNELKEVSQSLRNSKGELKPFNAFAQDVKKIDKQYNTNYLRAEYNFAVGSADMASRWESHADNDPHLLLQYRTAADEKVRDTHRDLHGVTLPKNDKFWNQFYPPNGWGCRCTVVEVLDDFHAPSDSARATESGNAMFASQGAKAGVFKFNPGKQKQLFPDKHPYYCRSRNSCGKAELAAKFGDNELCAGCLLLQEVQKERTRQKFKKVDREVREWGVKTLSKDQVKVYNNSDLLTGRIAMSNSIIKNLLRHTKSVETKELIYNIDKLKFELTGSAKLGAGKDMSNPIERKNIESKQSRGVVSYNYYKVKYGKLVIHADFEVHKNGYEQPFSLKITKPQ